MSSKTAAETDLIEYLAGTLDGMTPEAFDALPVGAIQVDGAGVIYRYNMTESRLSGRKVERVIGRNFFLDIAPCTNIPAFGGRFREGVQSGSLDARFEFVFDFHMAPVQVEIRMQPAAEPDRYWIIVRKIGDLSPNRPEHAVRVVAARAGTPITGTLADFSVCEREQIHLAGAIQPWGALLALSPADLSVQAVSANAEQMLARLIRIGDPLVDVLGPETAGEIGAWARAAGQTPSSRSRTFMHRNLDICVHRSPDHIIVEVEPLFGQRREGQAGLLTTLEEAAGSLREAETLAEVGQVAVRALRRLTGFERVLLYRFDGDWHGEVIAEDKIAEWEQSFAGMHFPASDIPRQARDLYTRSLSRHVPDRDYIPVPIHGCADGPALDLSLARHRSLSPAHLEYHRNMGVNGSMSFSVMDEGRLWGLVACHHRRPHHVDPPTRSAAMTLVETLALRLASVERAEAGRGRRGDMAVLNALMVQMAGADTIESGLAGAGTSLVNLFDASGAVAVLDGQTLSLGSAPPEPFTAVLQDWLSERWDAEGMFATENLSSLLPEAQEYRAMASGLLALKLGGGGFVAWFRPEQPQVITWGGDPFKPVAANGTSPLPRSSFERWVEERRGHAASWPPWAGEVAASLRHAIADVMLRHLRHVKELSLSLEASNAAKSDFLANMSHELRTPLNAVLGFSDLMISGVVGELTPRHLAYVQDIHSAGEHLLVLVNDLLDLSRIEAGQMELHLEPTDIVALATSCCSMLRPQAARKGVILSLAAEGSVSCPVDRQRVRQMLLNIVGNGIKFTPAGGSVDVAVAGDDRHVVLTVRDTGPGMEPEELALALLPFRQVSGATKSMEEGSGLGLPIARSLAELHGGSLTLASVSGQGTTVTIDLPRPPPT